MRAGSVVAALVLAGCEGDQAVLAPGGPQAGHISRLWWFYLAVLGAVFLLVVLFLLAAVLRRREDREGRWEGPALEAEQLPPEGARSRALSVLEPGRERRLGYGVAGATALTGVLLFVLLFTSIRTAGALQALPTQQAITIEVLGMQWWWRVRYLDEAHPSRVFTTANEIHIPVGRPVVFKLSSTDVIHSFWVPNLHGKRDLIPGQENTLALQADAPGIYRGQCAEFCGYQHARMSFEVVAESAEDFERWSEHQRQAAPEPVTPEQRRGQEVFLGGPCVMCHAIGGTLAGASVGPDLTHLKSRRTLAAGTLPHTRGNLAGWILNAQGLKPGSHMPSLSLPPEDFQALLSYLETLR